MHSHKENFTYWILNMLEASPQEWFVSNDNHALRAEIREHCHELVRNAYSQQNREALTNLHKILAHIYDVDFSSANIETVNCEMQPILRDIATILEAGMLNHEYAQIDLNLLNEIPTESSAYFKWLKKIISMHSSSIHPLYNDFMANHANQHHLAIYLAQETNLDPRFDDILAMLQVGLDIGAKLELANNYYDEMGNGNPLQVHSHLFKAALGAVGVDEQFLSENMLLDAQISGNLSAAFAMSRRHYFKAIGYFFVTEYLAPRRFKHVVNAWRRNCLPEVGIAYHDLHIVVDARHANGWFNNVISPLINKDPKMGYQIALGSLIRLNSSEKYLDSLLREFNQPTSLVHNKINVHQCTSVSLID